jgi:hypothetical protein
MKRLAMVAALGLGLLLSAGAADAQWRYTDDKGVSRVTQYKIDVPEPSRDAAEWIGPVGIGKPALSVEQLRAAQLSDAYRRIGSAEAGLVQFRNMPAAARPAPDPGGPTKAMATMCIAGEQRVMTSPGIWKVVGACSSDFSSSYGTGGYGTTGPSGGYPTH